MSKIAVKIKKTIDARDLPLPSYMTVGAAGLDLYANVKRPIVLQSGKIQVVPTGICVALPQGYEAQVRPRSGLAAKNGIGLVNSPGTIDSDYRGEIAVIMINFGENDFIIERGARIAQMVINKVEIVQLEIEEQLDDTDRGIGGFGHTGM